MGEILKKYIGLGVSGLVISSIQLPRTGGWDKFKPFTSELKYKVKGKYGIHFYFNGQKYRCWP